MEQSQKRKDIIKVAKLYYYGNLSQEQIAKLLGLSRPKVSRMLTEARQLNIVQISVRDPNLSYEEQEEKLRHRFGLEYIRIVPSGTTDEISKKNVGHAASDFLNSRIEEHTKIGISWGTTLCAFVREFQAKAPAPNAKVVQMVGGMYSQSLNIDGRELVKTLSSKLQCEHSLLQAPLLVRNPVLRELLMQEPSVIEHNTHIRTLDIAFVGLGHSYDFYKDSITYRAEYMEEAEARRLHEMGLVCDICGHQLLEDGTEPDTFLRSRVVGITLEEVHRVPLVVGLCAGHRKAQSIFAALRGNHINGLILDEVAAISLIAAAGLS